MTAMVTQYYKIQDGGRMVYSEVSAPAGYEQELPYGAIKLTAAAYAVELAQQRAEAAAAIAVAEQAVRDAAPQPPTDSPPDAETGDTGDTSGTGGDSGTGEPPATDPPTEEQQAALVELQTKLGDQLDLSPSAKDLLGGLLRA